MREEEGVEADEQADWHWQSADAPFEDKVNAWVMNLVTCCVYYPRYSADLLKSTAEQWRFGDRAVTLESLDTKEYSKLFWESCFKCVLTLGFSETIPQSLALCDVCKAPDLNAYLDKHLEFASHKQAVGDKSARFQPPQLPTMPNLMPSAHVHPSKGEQEEASEITEGEKSSKSPRIQPPQMPTMLAHSE